MVLDENIQEQSHIGRKEDNSCFSIYEAYNAEHNTNINSGFPFSLQHIVVFRLYRRTRIREIRK